MPNPRILVVGSMNMDLVAGAERSPGPGGNVRARSFETIPGGKGTNQAVACARPGAQPSMPTADEVADFLERHA